MILGSFIAPLYITTGVRKPKNNWLNMNNYRNWKHFQSNDLKILFKKSIDLSGMTKISVPVKITYSFFYPTHQRRDIDNSLAVIAKFSQDSLVEEGILADDDYSIVRQVTGIYGGYDKSNPRCEVTIEDY